MSNLWPVFIPCNPHYTSRSPEGESLEATGLKMLLTPLTNTSTTDCKVQALYQNTVIILSVCPPASSLSYSSPYQGKVYLQKLQGRGSLPKSEGQRRRKAHSKSLLVQGLVLVTAVLWQGIPCWKRRHIIKDVLLAVVYRRLHQLTMSKNCGTVAGGSVEEAPQKQSPGGCSP